MRLKNSTVYFLLIKVLLAKKNSIWEEKFKIEFLRTQLEFFLIQGLFEFIEDLIVRKINF